MSSDNVRIRVKIGANEIEIEGPKDSMKDMIGLIPEIGAAVSSVPAQSAPSPQPAQPAPTPQSQAPLQELPELKVEKGESLPSIMTKLFGAAWGRTPRRLLDVKGALESYGLVYPRQSVAVALLRLAQEGKLRRFKGADGDFLYTSSTSLLQQGEAPQPQPPEPAPEGPQQL